MIAHTGGVTTYFSSYLDFSQLKRLRIVQLGIPFNGSGRYSRIAVWMSPRGGNLAKRLHDNALRFRNYNPPTRESVAKVFYGIRLVSFQTSEIAEQFCAQDVEIWHYDMNVDVRIDTPCPVEVGFFDLLRASPNFRRKTDEERRIRDVSIASTSSTLSRRR